MPYPWECGDCALLDLNDSKWSEFYCTHNHYYVRADSPSCRRFVKRSGPGGCYLTTAMCNILGNEDHCYILDSLRGFRDNYMKKDQNCLPLLEDYDVIGPKISCCLEKDPKNYYVANFMLDSYLKPAVTLIENGCYDDAIEIYKDMTLGLANYYGLDVSNINCNKVIGGNVTRKKEICFD